MYHVETKDKVSGMSWSDKQQILGLIMERQNMESQVCHGKIGHKQSGLSWRHKRPTDRCIIERQETNSQICNVVTSSRHLSGG